VAVAYLVCCWVASVDMSVAAEAKWPVLGRHEQAALWLRVWADLGRVPRTMDAYSLSRARGPLFLSESARNRAAPLTLWTWSKVVRRLALAAELPQLSTHTIRHLCSTDLTRMGWELHAIAAFAGHRSTGSTLADIHYVRPRPLGEAELVHGADPHVAHRHAGRTRQRRQRAGHVGMNAVATTTRRTAGVSPATAIRFGGEGWDRRITLSENEIAAVLAIGSQALRRNRAVGIPRRTAPHWHALTRLVEPLDAVVAEFHHGGDDRFRRGGRQATAIVLQRCADFATRPTRLPRLLTAFCVRFCRFPSVRSRKSSARPDPLPELRPADHEARRR
jgi:integrase-like protein